MPFLQRYLGKSRPEDVTYADFQSFLAQKLGEHQTLEYKSGEVVVLMPDGKLKYPTDPRDIFGILEIAKAVAGLANAEGGLLVLGVRQKPEKHGKAIIGILPGAIKGVPGHITREVIENVLRAKIQYPVEGVTITAVRPSDRHRWFVYLIDVPQSTRPPHRVNELHYFQRHNFSTDPMLHYQIADLYGRRLGPNLEIELPPATLSASGGGRFTLGPRIRNHGNVVAKYVTVICAITRGDYAMISGGPTADWQVRPNQHSAQFTMGLETVVYPDTPSNTGELLIGPTGVTASGTTLQFYVYAEGMEAKTPVVEFTKDELPPWPVPETPAERALREEDEAREREEARLDRDS